MKITCLRFMNLNSLQGRWEIDFSDPSFTSEGIFAITGRTGAGKTTILDALCLALFGKTPRLHTISKSTNDIMSRHTGECMAEVEFSTPKGEFRAVWSQRRAHTKVDGALQAPEHTLADTASGMFIAEKTSDTVKMVEEVTGLNFMRFTRSVLLAQGNFAAFLQAKDEERSDVLEQLTGTEIYSDISRAVFQRNKEEKNTLGNLQKSLEDMRLLPPEEVENLTLEWQNEEKQIGIYTQERDTWQSALDWFAGVRQLEEELVVLTARTVEHEQTMERFIPSVAVLKRAQKALELDAPYTVVRTARKQMAEVEKQLTAHIQHRQNSEKELERCTTVCAETEKELVGLRKKHQQEKLVHVQVRKLDTQLAELMDTQRKAYTSYDVLRQEAEAAEKQFSAQGETLMAQCVDTFQVYCRRTLLSGHADLENAYWALEKEGERLQGQIRAVVEGDKEKKSQQEFFQQAQAQCQTMEKEKQAHQEALTQRQKEWHTLQGKRQELMGDASMQTLRKEFDAVQGQVATVQSAVNLCVRVLENAAEVQKYTTDKEQYGVRITTLATRLTSLEKEECALQVEKKTLEQASLHLSLNHYRDNLDDGEPCPLCGGLEHPYKYHAPDTDERAVEKLTVLEARLATHTQDIQEVHRQQSQIQGRLEALQEQLTKGQERLDNLTGSLREQVEALGVIWVAADADLLATLRTQHDALVTRGEALRKTFADYDTFSQQIEQITTTMESQRETLSASELALQQVETTRKNHKEQLELLEKTGQTAGKNVHEALVIWQERLQSFILSSRPLGISSSHGGDDMRSQGGSGLCPSKGVALSFHEGGIGSNPHEGGVIPCLHESNGDLCPHDIPDASSHTPYVVCSDVSRHLSISFMALVPELPASLQETLKKRLSTMDASFSETVSDLLTAETKAQELFTLTHTQLTEQEAQVGEALQLLAEWRNRWLKVAADYNEGMQSIAISAPLVVSAKGRFEKAREEARQGEKEYASVRTRRDALQHERRNLLGEHDVDERERAMAAADTAAEKKHGEAESTRHVLAGTVATLAEQEGTLTKQHIALHTTLVQEETLFITLLEKQGFTDEKTFVASCLGAEERKALEEKERSLQDTKLELMGKKRERELLLQEKRSQPPVEETEEVVRGQHTALLEKIQQSYERIGGFREKLTNNELLQNQKQERLEKILAQQQECSQWAALDALIGSADGKKYRQFAQGLTFEAVIIEANKVLARLSDRYTLLRDAEKPLELNVCDSDQAGEVRSTRNLSGGESFIVSLALALGLSSMASRSIQLDSLFLDEGFGALDEDTLDVALDVLASLPDDGKIIGIISHVSSLKERIRKNIQITPLAGGRSKLEEGDGVRRL